MLLEDRLGEVVEVERGAWRRLARRASAWSRIAAMRRCSARGGSGIGNALRSAWTRVRGVAAASDSAAKCDRSAELGSGQVARSTCLPALDREAMRTADALELSGRPTCRFGRNLPKRTCPRERTLVLGD